MYLIENEKVQVALSGAVVANECQVSASYTRISGAASGNNFRAEVPKVTRAVTSGATQVDMTSAPPTGSVDRLDSAHVYNADTAAVVATIRTTDGTTNSKRVTMTIPANDTLCYERGGGWYLGSSRNPAAQVYTSSDALTALAGGAQAGTALTADYNRATTVASANDSFQLPAATAGHKPIYFENSAAANACKVFPQTGETIDTGAANAGFSVAAGVGVIFFCVSAGHWSAVSA